MKKSEERKPEGKRGGEQRVKEQENAEKGK
jgi:hypothetical protein